VCSPLPDERERAQGTARLRPMLDAAGVGYVDRPDDLDPNAL
jgi:hypothetical protein